MINVNVIFHNIKYIVGNHMILAIMIKNGHHLDWITLNVVANAWVIMRYTVTVSNCFSDSLMVEVSILNTPHWHTSWHWTGRIIPLKVFKCHLRALLWLFLTILMIKAEKQLGDSIMTPRKWTNSEIVEPSSSSSLSQSSSFRPQIHLQPFSFCLHWVIWSLPGPSGAVLISTEPH